jgi:hypothetical protein
MTRYGWPALVDGFEHKEKNIDVPNPPHCEGDGYVLATRPARQRLRSLLVGHSFEVPESDELPGAFKEVSGLHVLPAGKAARLMRVCSDLACRQKADAVFVACAWPAEHARRDCDQPSSAGALSPLGPKASRSAQRAPIACQVSLFERIHDRRMLAYQVHQRDGA